VLILSTHDLDECAFGALHAGGFLLKDLHPGAPPTVYPEADHPRVEILVN